MEGSVAGRGTCCAMTTCDEHIIGKAFTRAVYKVVREGMAACRVTASDYIWRAAWIERGSRAS
jgi:hypothetical protein